jgi:hypothetical protein
MKKNRHSSLRRSVFAIVCAVLGTGAAMAADNDSTAQARYQREMAVCDSGQSNQDVATCRIEARNALAAARQGALTDAPGQYKDNAQQRCGVLEGVELRACEARMRGEGSVEGSVAGGGLLRENVTVVPAK